MEEGSQAKSEMATPGVTGVTGVTYSDLKEGGCWHEQLKSLREGNRE